MGEPLRIRLKGWTAISIAHVAAVGIAHSDLPDGLKGNPSEIDVELLDTSNWYNTTAPMRFCEIRPEVPSEASEAVKLFREILMTDTYAKRYAQSQRNHAEDSDLYCWSSWKNLRFDAAMYAAKFDVHEMTDLLAQFYGLDAVAGPEYTDRVEVEALLRKIEGCSKPFGESNFSNCSATYKELGEAFAEVHVTKPQYGETKYQLVKRAGSARAYWIPLRSRVIAIH